MMHEPCQKHYAHTHFQQNRFVDPDMKPISAGIYVNNTKYQHGY